MWHLRIFSESKVLEVEKGAWIAIRVELEA